MSKSRRMRHTILSLATVSAFVLALPSLAGASVAADPWEDRQHAVLDAAKQAAAAHSGSPVPLVADNFQVLGHANLGGGVPNGDVWFHDHGGAVGKFAYVGTWSAQCTGQGAKVVDVNDPTMPKWEGYVGARKNSSNEDVVVRRIGNRDVLGIGVQACGPGGADGLALFDVTNPREPVELSFLPTPTGVHELDLTVRANGKALALLATPYSEFSDTYFGTSFGGEFRIVDISKPKAPKPLSDWGIIADSDLLIQGGNDPVSSSFQGLPGFFAATYAHSVRAADAGTTAYVSYWDAGILKFDISNPSAPVYRGRTIYPTGSSGDGHSMTPYQVGGTRYILQNDEDFQSLPDVVVTSSATGARAVEGIQQPWAPVLLTAGGQSVSGTVHDAGDGCQASDYAGAAGKLALADSIDPFYVGIIPGWPVPPCTIGQQTLLAAAAGATAFVSNLVSPDDAYVLAPGVDPRALAAAGVPVFQIADIDDVADAIRAAAGPVTLTVTAQTPSWGYLRVFREDASGEWQQVGRFTDAPHAFGEHPTPPGSWSIHNTEVLGDRAYSSWYSNGIVAIDLSNPTQPQRVGQFVPDTSRRHANSLGVGPAEVWGVAIDPETGIAYASDMRTGLWIVQPTGPAAPSS
jgi:hypothetical protein